MHPEINAGSPASVINTNNDDLAALDNVEMGIDWNEYEPPREDEDYCMQDDWPPEVEREFWDWVAEAEQREAKRRADSRPFTTARVSDTCSLPEISAGIVDLTRVTNLAWQAVREKNARDAYLFNRGREMVRLEFREDADGQIVPAPGLLTHSVARHELARVANWVIKKDGKIFDSRPPAEVVQDFLATPNPPLPTLSRIVHVPVFSPSGNLITTPGYSPETRCYYWRPSGLVLRPVSPNPTDREIRQAIELLKEPFLDFPFASDADLAHTIELVLLPYTRDMIDGPTPNHLVSGHTPSSGKGKLVDAALTPSVRLAKMTQQTGESEWRWAIGEYISQGYDAIQIDNITKPLDSGVLASALTEATFSTRRVGSHRVPVYSVRNIWVTTGNNPQLSTELTRRSIRIHLDAKTEQPWRRDPSMFRHPDLISWVRKHKRDLIWAAHTTIRGWVKDGRRQCSGQSLGSYERWAAVQGGILDYLGFDGFLGNLDALYEGTDREHEKLSLFVQDWIVQYGEKPVTSTALIAAALAAGIDTGTSKDSKDRAQKLGYFLRDKRNRIVGGYRITSRSANNTTQWRLEKVA